MRIPIGKPRMIVAERKRTESEKFNSVHKKFVILPRYCYDTKQYRCMENLYYVYWYVGRYEGQYNKFYFYTKEGANTVDLKEYTE